MGTIVIVMGSKSDLEHVNKIVDRLDAWGVPHVSRVASAHKSVRHLLALLAEYESIDEPLVYIAVAGRSNALGGMMDANTVHPVITCPPVSSTFGGADIYSSLRMPSGVAPMVVLDPGAAALAACKVLALSDAGLAERIAEFQKGMVDVIVDADESVSGH